MNKIKKALFGVTSSAAAITATAGAFNPTIIQGYLISKLGLTQSVALAIVTALTTSGGALVSVLFPFIAPFVATLDGIIAIAGTAAAVGW
jgi:hypothetical protein